MPTETAFPEPASPLASLSAEQIEAIGREFDAIHDEVFDELGDRDAKYIRSMIDMHRRLALLGRVLLIGARVRPLWWAGTATLSLAKILENMEIGHNVMHGQWDWMNDPVINSSAWDWDSASTPEAWKHSHNYVHHTYTNIRGKDKDLGYEIMRIDPHQPWHPVYLLQPLYNIVLAAFFEWGVAFHDLDFDAIKAGEKSQKEVRRQLKGMAAKARSQIVKDYIAFPLLSGLIMALPDRRAAEREHEVAGRFEKARRRITARRRGRGQVFREDLAVPVLTGQTFRSTFWANFTANIVRNVWAYAIIFCGHFPDQTYTFSREETDDESRGARHVRQLLGAANIEGSPLFHVISGNLGYQVEHHIYPDMPSTRYGEIAPRVRAICERYDLPYNTGPFLKQLGMVQRTILRLAFPGGRPRPKPGPYRGELFMNDGERAATERAAA
ncbi:MAG: NADPH-dependent stearoyl-CoA 9-desaturase [Solirubrobacteraceae bacterium]|jgi:linoleoyl-CoA desaturase|nr:NADPH-dependent stearoyl-CoA 9-desaturase [Solirubrobacteraceae bacterium]